MNNSVLIMFFWLIPLFGSAQCGNTSVEVENNSLFVYQDSIYLNCKAEMHFFVEKNKDTINLYEINQNVEFQCGYYPNNFISELTNISSGTYMLKIYYQLSSDWGTDTIFCAQKEFTIEPGYTTDSIYINSCLINGDTCTNVHTILSTNTNNIAHNSFRVSQNLPNPFSQKTCIQLYIPHNIKKSIIYFYDAFGRLHHLKEIRERGLYDFSIFNNYSPGIYFYYIVYDNMKSETKKMIVVK